MRWAITLEISAIADGNLQRPSAGAGHVGASERDTTSSGISRSITTLDQS
jgi:hypothetical protein